MEIMNIIGSNPVIFMSIIFSNIIISIIMTVISIVSISKYKKLNTRYNKFMKKIGVGEKFEEQLSEYTDEVVKIQDKNKEIERKLETLENNLKKCVQKVGLVRYNAYNDTGSDLSFTMALMDSDNNGVVVNGLYSRESSSIFAKPLVKGETKYNLSAEEIQAIDIAKTSSLARY